MTDYNLERLNFLIVDDDKHMRAPVTTILKALGVMNVMEAAGGVSACHFPAYTYRLDLYGISLHAGGSGSGILTFR